MFLNTHETEAWWLERMLDKSNMVTSYKAYWMMSIIDIIVEKEKSELSFEEIVNRMIVHAWYPSVTYKLSFGVQDRLPKIIKYISDTYPCTKNMKADKLLQFISESEDLNADRTFIKMRTERYQMVPYRLLNPFFKEATRGIKDQKKNRLISLLSSESYISMYHFSSDSLSIKVRPNWMSYITRNQSIIKAWIQYKLVLYLQARNPSVPNIIMKLKAPGTRNLRAAKKFWETVTETQIINDIYTGKHLNQVNYNDLGSLSIDHFIPWTFVSHDEFWNLCPTFKNVNSSKSDGLPALNNYLDDYCLLHYHAINELKTYTGGKKILEDYYTISGDLTPVICSDEPIERSLIQSTIEKAIIPIHQIALNQGFDEWSYKS